MRLVLAAAMAAACILLVVSGLGHVRRQEAFISVIDAHRVLPRRATRVAARGFTALELCVGAAGTVTLLGSAANGMPAEWLAAAGTAVAALYLLMAAYECVVLQVTPLAPCGCFDNSTPVSWLGVTVNFALAIGSLAAAVGVVAPRGVPSLVGFAIGLPLAWFLGLILQHRTPLSG